MYYAISILADVSTCLKVNLSLKITIKITGVNKIHIMFILSLLLRKIIFIMKQSGLA